VARPNAIAWTWVLLLVILFLGVLIVLCLGAVVLRLRKLIVLRVDSFKLVLVDCSSLYRRGKLGVLGGLFIARR
jgi:hypothetical protein